MKKVLFLFLLLYSIVVSSQNEEKTIIVKDIDTEKPIEDATIFISKTKQTLLSNAEGTASFILNGIFKYKNAPLIITTVFFNKLTS